MGVAGSWKWESEHETGIEKLERNKDADPAQTVVMRDGFEIAWLVVHVCETETKMERDCVVVESETGRENHTNSVIRVLSLQHKSKCNIDSEIKKYTLSGNTLSLVLNPDRN